MNHTRQMLNAIVAILIGLAVVAGSAVHPNTVRADEENQTPTPTPCVTRTPGPTPTPTGLGGNGDPDHGLC